MPKWNVYGIVTGSKFLGVVEAETEDEAKDKAFDELEVGVSLCHHCDSECGDAQIEDLDVQKETE